MLVYQRVGQGKVSIFLRIGWCRPRVISCDFPPFMDGYHWDAKSIFLIRCHAKIPVGYLHNRIIHINIYIYTHLYISYDIPIKSPSNAVKSSLDPMESHYIPWYMNLSSQSHCIYIYIYLSICLSVFLYLSLYLSSPNLSSLILSYLIYLSMLSFPSFPSFPSFLSFLSILSILSIL